MARPRYQNLVDAGCDLVTVWGLDPDVAAKAQNLGMYSEGVLNTRLYIISGRRTCEEQAALHRKGTGTRPGYSAHQVGRAFDVGFDFDPAPHVKPQLDAYAICLGLRAGSRFIPPDPNHYDDHPNPGERLVDCP